MRDLQTGHEALSKKEKESILRCCARIDKIFKARVDEMREQINADLHQLGQTETRENVIDALVASLIECALTRR